ncbi:MAG TPA: hypothetical protein VE077_20880 [Candidatus Methylomirabilis sp.]|nr:hypothetical protein [Candidatus Methylomirabilis sp.]
MAPDDRDRTFEKALARHLRYSVPDSAEEASPTPALLPCPEAEILAGYHDGSLTPEERALWKRHVLSCDRCQLVLEHLATPLEVSFNIQSADPQSGVAPVKEVPVGKEDSARAATLAPVSRPAPRRNFLWWLVPAGAVAVAAFVAFVALRPAKPTATLQSAPVEVARNQEPPPPQAAKVAPLVSKALPSAPSAVPKAKERDAFVAGGAASAARATDEKDLRAQIQLAQRVPQPSKSVPRASQLDDTDKLEANSAAAASGGGVSNEKQDQLKQQVAALDTEMKKQGVAQQAAPAAPAPLTAAGQAGYLADSSLASGARAKSVTAPPAAPPAPTETRGDALSSAPSAAESVEVSGQLQSTVKMRAALLQNPHVLGAPGGKVFWRVGPAGSVERSTNMGKDWTAQASGVNTDLLAGSAPSAKVCWVIGGAGTILRTTDGGAHWTKLNSPAAGELAGINATDALHASIRFAPNPGASSAPRFQTSDGGATWTAVPGN